MVVKKILISLFVIFRCTEDATGKNLVGDLSVYDGNAHSKAELERIFSELSPDHEVIRTEYDVHEEYASICWTERTILHFYTNGTNNGYTEYSISVELTPQEHVPDNEVPTEPYEITERSSKRTRVLNFATIRSIAEETVKENRNVTCKSAKAYSKLLTKLANNRKIEIKLKPVLEDLQIEAVHSKKEETGEKAATRSFNEDSSGHVDTTEEISRGILELFDANGDVVPHKKENESVSHKISSESQGSSQVESNLQNAGETRIGNSEEKGSGEEKGVSSEESAFSIDYGTASTLQPLDNNVAANHGELISEAAAVLARETSQLLGTANGQPLLENLDGSSRDVHERKLEVSAPEDQANRCSTTGKVIVKVKLDILDDVGKIKEIQKDLEIDLKQPYQDEVVGDFDQQLLSLIRGYFGDVLFQHKLCEDTKGSPSLSHTMLRSFQAGYDDQDQGFYTNPYFASPSNNFYRGLQGQYYIAPRTLPEPEDTKPTFFETLSKISNNLKEAYTKLSNY